MAGLEKLEDLKTLYAEKKHDIQAQLNEFEEVHQNADDRRIFEELTFCILTSAVGPKVNAKSLEAIKDILLEASAEDLEERLKGVHKYPEKAYYIVHTRDYLKSEYGLNLKSLINSFKDPLELREFFALNKDVKGLGLTQASHFLRNIGIKGYAILDSNSEEKMKQFANKLGIEVEKLDMLLWSTKTGHIPK
jgi:N-glycosylase/DNA lyase